MQYNDLHEYENICAQDSHYEVWLEKFNTEQEAESPEIRYTLADPGSDGLRNLVEYSTGSDPSRPFEGDSLLAPLVIEPAGNQAKLSVSHDRYTFSNEIEVKYQYSDDLLNWQPLQSSQFDEMIEAIGDKETVAIIPKPSVAYPFFVRLGVKDD